MGKFVSPQEMASLLAGHAGRLVLVAHMRPDGDAAGSALGLCAALKAVGQNAVCAGIEPLAPEYDYLEGLAEVIPALEYAPLPEDAMVVMDCGALSRIAEPLRAHAAKNAVFCVDHHKDYSDFAEYAFIKEGASSAAEMVMEVVEAGGLPLTRGVAEALWTGIATDTGRFSYASTTAETLRRAARLVDAGARFAWINERIFGRMELKRIMLRRRLLDSLEVAPSGKSVVGSLGPEDYAAEKCDASDSDSFIDIVRSVSGTDIAVFLRKTLPEGSVKISMRTTERFDAAAICKAEWGGGGHARAAGAELSGDIREVRAAVFARVQAIADAGA